MKVKKLLCLALAAALTCPGLPAQAAQTQATSTAAQSEHAISPANALADTDEFQFDEFGRLIEYTGEGGDVVIPDGVTGILYAFKNCASLTSVMRLLASQKVSLTLATAHFTAAPTWPVWIYAKENSQMSFTLATAHLKTAPT